MLRKLLPVLLMLTLSACAAVPLPKETVAVHGMAIDTLQSSVNISLTSPAGQMSGNGVLSYQRPESFRLTILAPFGQTVLDIVIKGDTVLCLMEGKKKGWQGSMQDLPEGLGMRIWPLLTWMVEPPHPAGPARERPFTRADGTVETVYYDSAGFVQKKVNAAGDEIMYSDYRLSDGIAVPNVIELRTAVGSSLRLVLDEPEVNRPLDSDIFSPPLDRYEILPLADFQGF
jgi:outer membrane biogenesis lipoprotein LolB